MFCILIIAFWGAIISGVTSFASSKKKKEAAEERAEASETDPWADRGGSTGMILIGGVILIIAIIAGLSVWKK